MIEKEIKLPCGVILKNRIAKSAMSENMGTKDLKPNHKFENLYRTWAQGGAGLVISGNVMLDKNALGEPRNVVIEKDHECLEELKAWAKAGTENGTHLWMQINHPGKQTPKTLTPEPVAPSPIGYGKPMSSLFNVPRELTENEILDIVERFAYTASIAKEAGFSGVQIHGAHGYLVSQFLSPKHNQRTDDWGGSLGNRSRFVREIYKSIREAVGADFPVGIKLNSADFQKGGFSEEDSMEIVKMLSELGIDLIEISGGTYEAPKMMKGDEGEKPKVVKESTKIREAYFSEYCEKVRKLVSTPILLTGGFRTAEGMNNALASEACDLVGIARAIAIDPEFPSKLLSGEPVQSLVKPLTSGFKFIDNIIPIEITWYTEQLHLMGEGKRPSPNASVKMNVLKTIWSLGMQGVQRNRSK